MQRAFDVDADGQLDTFDWYGLQGCYARTGGRCAELFDADGSGGVGQADVVAFEAEASGLFGGPSRPRWRRGLIASRYGNPFMWTGQRFDPTTGQYHFWARTYSPRLGRWLQRDPLEYVDGVSLYTAVASRPTSNTDPLGLWYSPANPFEEYRWPHAGEGQGGGGVNALELNDALKLGYVSSRMAMRAFALAKAEAAHAALLAKIAGYAAEIERLVAERAALLSELSDNKLTLSAFERQLKLFKIWQNSAYIEAFSKTLSALGTLAQWGKWVVKRLRYLFVLDAWRVGRRLGDPVGKRLDDWYLSVGLWEDYLARLFEHFGITLPIPRPSRERVSDEVWRDFLGRHGGILDRTPGTHRTEQDRWGRQAGTECF